MVLIYWNIPVLSSQSQFGPAKAWTCAPPPKDFPKNNADRSEGYSARWAFFKWDQLWNLQIKKYFLKSTKVFSFFLKNNASIQHHNNKKKKGYLFYLFKIYYLKISLFSHFLQKKIIFYLTVRFIPDIIAYLFRLYCDVIDKPDIMAYLFRLYCDVIDQR